MTKNIFYERLIAVIDKSFEHRFINENIRIDKLEIDIDATSVDDLPLLVERELERVLSGYPTGKNSSDSKENACNGMMSGMTAPNNNNIVLSILHDHDYFPIQKFEKISPSKSSWRYSPVIKPSCSCASLSNCAAISS